MKSPGDLSISLICSMACLFIDSEFPFTAPQICGFLPACFCKEWPALVSPPLFLIILAVSLILSTSTIFTIYDALSTAFVAFEASLALSAAFATFDASVITSRAYNPLLAALAPLATLLVFKVTISASSHPAASKRLVSHLFQDLSL